MATQVTKEKAGEQFEFKADSNAETLDAQGLLIDFREVPSSREQEPVRRIAMIEESGGDTSESLKLLRTRLAAVSLALAIGFGIFAIWFTIGEWVGWLPHHPVWLAAQFGVTLVLLGTWMWLRRTHDLTAGCARSIEFLVFALPAFYFVAITAKYFIQNAMEYGHVQSVALHGWMILIFAHSIFIPNPWRRAAMVSIAFAILPILTALGTACFCEAVRKDFIHSPSLIVEMILGLTATCLVAVIGYAPFFTCGQKRPKPRSLDVIV